MKDFVLMFCNISFMACEMVSAYLYSDCVERLLEKDRRWINSLLGSVSIVVMLTLIYTWLPGRIGAEVTLFEEMITLKDGALFQNLALMSVAQAFAIVLAVLKYLWNVIRRRARFRFLFLVIELMFAALFVTAAVYLGQNETVIPFREDTQAAYLVTGLIAAAGILLLLWPVPGEKEKKKSSAQTGAKGNARKENVLSEDHERFVELVNTKNRLTQAGDFSTQIPLLTEATGWKLSRDEKIRVWNYMGMAYEQIGSKERAEECYKTAAKIK